MKMKELYPPQNQSILDQLSSLGLGQTDAMVYLTGVRLGACTVGQMTKQTGINRITTHDSIQRLIDKGLIQETFAGRRRLVYPSGIEQLQRLVEIKRLEVDQLQTSVTKAIQSLSALHLQATYLPQVRIAKGRQGIQEVIQELKQDQSELIQIISDSWHFDELLTVDFMESMKRYSGSIQMLIPAGFEHFIFSAIAKGLSIQTKILDESIHRRGGVTLRGDKVAFHAYEGIYITTTIIQNPPIVGMIKVFLDGYMISGKL